MKLPGRNDKPVPGETSAATLHLGELSQKVVPFLEGANGATWYEEPENKVDIAVLALCRLRRAGAGSRGSAEGGDAAVREALAQANPETVLWVASRAISYMDEQGFLESLTESRSGR